MSVTKTKALLFAGALVMTVLLFIAPRTKPTPKVGGQGEKAANTGNIESVELYRNMATKSLDPKEKARHDRLDKKNDFDSLQEFWVRMKRPDLSALAAERKAMKSDNAADYFLAGNRYYNAVRFTSDNSELPLLYQSAIRCFGEGLKKEPANADAKIMLASCYVEGSQDPMQGIRLLQEVEQTDSNNVKLQMSFAFFSVKSGQLDKAIERFNKVLAIDSSHIEAYLHLADAYEQQQNTAATISALEKYAARTDDITAKTEVIKYIDQLKTKHNN